jgi:hypothetical protein
MKEELDAVEELANFAGLPEAKRGEAEVMVRRMVESDELYQDESPREMACIAIRKVEDG